MLRASSCVAIALIACSIVANVLLKWSLSVETLTDASSCPACYGKHDCRGLTLDRWNLVQFFDVRNVYYGALNNESVVIKKLGQDYEIEKFDGDLRRIVEDEICRNDRPTCEASSSDIEKLVTHGNSSLSGIIKRWPELFENSDILKCRNDRLTRIIESSFGISGEMEGLMHLTTMLAVNPEPVVLEVSFLCHFFSI